MPLFILRSAFNGCCYPLEESTMMDNVEQKDRAKWQSLDSVCSTGWCGSAFLGGMIADKYSYSFTFLITAAFQLFGALTYILVRPLVEKEN